MRRSFENRLESLSNDTNGNQKKERTARARPELRPRNGLKILFR